MTMLAITGIGMTTAVGPDARTSPAAFRAGVSLARELSYFVALDEEETDVGPIAGHIAAPNALHTEGLGKIVALGAGALRAIVNASGGKVGGQRTGLYLALPNFSLREDTYVDFGPPTVPGGRRSLAPGNDEVPRSRTFAQQCEDHLVERLGRAARVDLAAEVVEIRFGDNCTFLRALDAAITGLGSGAVDRCIVGGIDSYLDVPSLEWGMLRRRLKSETNPVGFAPGEAAVFLELAARPPAGTEVLGIVSKPGFGDEPGQVPAPEVQAPRGIGLSLAIRTAIRNAQRPVGLVIADLNGDDRRAADWGHALVRVAGEQPSLRDAPIWTPATSFGETGCASAGLAIGVAIEALGRGYAGSDSILVVSSSATADRGAVVVGGVP